MAKTKTHERQIVLIIGALITWFAIGLQFYLIIVNRIASVTETIIRFFSFFTILTNILVAVCFTVLLLKPNSRWGSFFSRFSVLTAITIYILVVGLLYNLILRQLWNPVGFQRIADELLHVVNPMLFILHWILFSPKVKLAWKSVFPWLMYPFVYACFILFRGVFAQFYPYPFIDVTAMGYNQVFINCGALFLAFLLLSLVFVAITKEISNDEKA